MKNFADEPVTVYVNHTCSPVGRIQVNTYISQLTNVHPNNFHLNFNSVTKLQLSM